MAWGRENASHVATPTPLVAAVTPTNSPDPHFPNIAPIAREYPQMVAPPASAPTANSEPLAAGKGRLAKLYASVDTRGWTLAAVPDFPISAKMPPGYFANFRVFNLLDGRQGYDLTITNFDLDEKKASVPTGGSPPPPNRVGVNAQLYPSGPGVIGQIDAVTTDITTFVAPGLGNAPIYLRQERWQGQFGPEAHEVHTTTQVPLSEGRYLVLSASTSSPDDDRLVRDLIGVLASLGVK